MPTLISIIVPVYNEQDNIGIVYGELKKLASSLNNYEFEYIFTDNCSTDNTFSKLVEIARDDPMVRVARFARNFGFHKSVLTGYRLSRGAAAVQIDADLQDPPELIRTFLEKWREGHDVVVGIRRLRHEPVAIQFMRKAYYRLLSRLDGPHLVHDAGDFRLVDASIIRSLRRIDDAHPYLRGLISSLARNQTGVVYDRHERVHGESKFPLRKLVNMSVDGIVTHSRAPLKIAFFAGIGTAILALSLILYFFYSRMFLSTQWPAGLATTQILILSGIALNGLFMGILGIYLGRIYDQVRRRPTTVIAQALNLDDLPREEGGDMAFDIGLPSVAAVPPQSHDASKVD